MRSAARIERTRGMLPAMRSFALLCIAAAAVSVGFVACSTDTSSSGGDAGTAPDGGVDTGVSTTRPDTSTGDAGAADTGTAQDAGTDSAAALCDSTFAGCTEVDAGGEAGVGNVFLDVGAADQTIDFGGSLGTVYAPRCLKIKAGQKVTWNGDFSSHPLTAAGCNPPGGDAIPATSTGTTTSVTFATKGTYGFYCMNHGAGGGSASAMNGLIVVY
jgi:plastocyanin